MATFVIKRGDTAPVLPVMLQNPDGTPANLTGAAVRFVMQNAVGTDVVSRAAAIVDLPTASVNFNWQSSDTAVAGDFRAEFEVTFLDGSIGTFPNNGYLTVQIVPDL